MAWRIHRLELAEVYSRNPHEIDEWDILTIREAIERQTAIAKAAEAKSKK